ncbi:MAG: metalloregulator ArsR/SmtB family transcription factor [Ilumatobacteraceae bacterium]
MAIDTLTHRNEETIALARFFRVLGDSTRLQILELLLIGPHSVSELVEATGAPQARVSNHLACLRWCRFVEAERDGRSAIYRIVDPRIGLILEAGRKLTRGHYEHLIACKRIGPGWI